MKSFSKVLAIIRRQRTFLLTMHQNPDADALSSSLAMAIFLKSLGKKVYVLNEDACPSWLAFLPKTLWLKKASMVKRLGYDAAIVLDCGDLKRIGKVADFIDSKKPLVNIDHHVTNDRFGSVNIIDAQASSTCEMVFDLFKEGGYALNKNLSMLLYAGIMTDTGSFRYDNTSGRTHAVVRELMRYKFSVADMYNRLYSGIPVGDMKKFTDVIHNAHLFYKDRLYCVVLPRKVVESFSKGFDLKEKLFAFLRSIEGVEVVAILTQLGAKEVRVNLRSQGRFDVAALAQQFNGGGHYKAAGCKIYEPLQNAEKIICTAIGKKL